jgi:hypothetical protein
MKSNEHHLKYEKAGRLKLFPLKYPELLPSKVETPKSANDKTTDEKSRKNFPLIYARPYYRARKYDLF